MRVRTFMAPEVIATALGESLYDAARRMRADGISALPVLEGDELVGIITERDIVTAFVDGLDPYRTHVSSCMTSAPQVASPDEPVSEAALRMIDGGVRHLPVVEGRRVVGMLSARDLMAPELLPER
jgi:CBS domain-containing protein